MVLIFVHQWSLLHVVFQDVSSTFYHMSSVENIALRLNYIFLWAGSDIRAIYPPGHAAQHLDMQSLKQQPKQ